MWLNFWQIVSEKNNPFFLEVNSLTDKNIILYKSNNKCFIIFKKSFKFYEA